jgi:polyisoprenoid-binding protein YceI
MKLCKSVVPLRTLLLCLLFSPISRAQAPGDVPGFEVIPEGSTVSFSVKASVAIQGAFDKWDAKLAFTSANVLAGVLDVKIDAASVDTGSGMKNKKLKGKDFFNVKENPYITFHSEKVVETGPDTVELSGTFTIRGVSKPETLKLTIVGKGTGEGEINGTMAFDRKQYGMNSGIPFIKIADRVEVKVNLKAKRVSGPPVVFQQ